MTLAEIIERASLAVQHSRSDVPLARIRVAVEAGFDTVLRDVSEAFAATAKGDQLRQDVALTFSGGFVTCPDNVLLKYLKTARLFTADTNAFYSFEREGTQVDQLDPRLGYWKLTGTTIEARTPNSTDPASGLDGSATLDAICRPDIPALATTVFAGPEDMIPQLIDALAAKASFAMRKIA